LLAEARNELEPRQWELLDTKLTEVERAFERFNRAAAASGKVAEVARGTDGVADAGRTGEVTEGIGAVARAGPLLALLILLWPAETAGPEYDHGPDWLPPEQELKAKLREVSKAAQQVRSELAAARRAPPVEAVGRQTESRSPKIRFWQPQGWVPTQGAPPWGPCGYRGAGGPGINLPPNAPPALVRCTYQCEYYLVDLFIIASSAQDCEKPGLLERAEDLAKRFHKARKKGP
jgi:hypothetical protein